MTDDRIHQVALAAAEFAAELVPAWLPEGKRKGDEWETLNPVRGDRSPGSFHINLATGAWNDFADETAKGGDLVSLRAYLDDARQLDAAHAIDQELSLGLFQDGAGAPVDRKSTDERRRKAKQRASEREQEKQRAQSEAAEKAHQEWEAAVAASEDHPYLTRKGVPAYGLRQNGQQLLVPLYHNKRLVNLERITPDGDKRSLKGALKKGAYSCIGKLDRRSSQVYVCEGWATGASLHRATGRPVICAMTAGNLVLVATEIRAEFGPGIRIDVAGDEDRDQEENPGRKEAMRAAQKARGTAIFPRKPPQFADASKWDFNDLDIALGDKRSMLIAHADQYTPTPDPSENVPIVDRPSFGVYEDWVRIEGQTRGPGVWRHTFKDEGEGEPVDTRICAPLKVSAKTHNIDDDSAGLLLEFTSSTTGKSMEWVMPMRYLAGKPDKLLEALMGMGLEVAHRQRPAVQEYIASRQHSDQRLLMTGRIGWLASSEQDLECFVLPDGAIGRDDVLFQTDAAAESVFAARGNLSGWNHEVATRCQGNPVLILSIGVALAGPLLRPLKIQGGGIHLVGDSSSGKSLAQMVSASVWGDPSSFVGSWDVTPGGLEAEASFRNDTVLILDEIKRAKVRDVQTMVYSLANGVGRTTMTRERESRPRRTWRLLSLSSGERSLAEHAGSEGDTAHAGAELRMVDVNAGTRRYRAFDELHGMTGAEFHQKLSFSLMRHYGQLGREFAAALVDGISQEEIESRFTHVRTQFEDAGAQAGRVADRFAAVALAVELAISWKLIPWPEGAGIEAANQLYQEWIESFGRMGGEDRQILMAIHDFLQAHGDSRFSSVRDLYEISVRNRAGYYETVSGTRMFLMSRAALQEAAPGYGIQRIVTALRSWDVLNPGDGKNATRKYQIPGGGRSRFYVIDADKLQETLTKAA